MEHRQVGDHKRVDLNRPYCHDCEREFPNDTQMSQENCDKDGQRGTASGWMASSTGRNR